MKRVRWRCPNCQGPDLIEISSGCKVQTRIDGLDGSGQLVFDVQDVQLGVPESYVCNHCQKPIEDSNGPITTRERMTSYLRHLLKTQKE